MYRSKRWTIAEPNAAAAELATRLKVSPLVAQVLLNRGMSEPEECLAFMRPSLKALHEPAGIPGLPAASERIARAIRDKQKIVIYGDYDVDGITATAILWHAIRILGGVVEYYIPHRIDEGYGLNAEAVGSIIDGGAQLIVSVDCGITAVEPARLARERGVDLIITDHHEWHEVKADGAASPLLPECTHIVHPRLPGAASPYPNPHLCGAGVAFKLAWGIGLAMSGAVRVSETFRNFLIDATALAALGTIADVVPLIGENRILAHFGLGGLKESKLTGIRALIQSAALTGQNLDSYHVGFLLAPRLNACGRMGHARLAVEMMTDAGEERAREIAVYLEDQNRERQAIERTILDQALAQVGEHGWDSDENRALVLGMEGWHAGVIGIVASRLVDRLCRPAIMIAITNGTGQGSGRSVAGFHLSRALAACGEHLTAFGGHEMAAGLKVKTEKLEDFRRAFCDYARSVVSSEMLVPEIKVESIASLAHVTEGLVADLRRLGPFGHGNRKPLLCVKSVTVGGVRTCGRNNAHVQMIARQSDLTIKCIHFNAAELAPKLQSGVEVDLVVEPMVNTFNGRSNVELEVKDLRLTRER